MVASHAAAGRPLTQVPMMAAEVGVGSPPPKPAAFDEKLRAEGEEEVRRTELRTLRPAQGEVLAGQDLRSGKLRCAEAVEVAEPGAWEAPVECPLLLLMM